MDPIKNFKKLFPNQSKTFLIGMEEYTVNKCALGDYACYLEFIKQRGLLQTLTVTAPIDTKNNLPIK